MIIFTAVLLLTVFGDAAAGSISAQELWNITRHASEPVAILFHNNASADVSWWTELDVNVTRHEFATDNILNSLEAKSQNIRKLPTIKLYHYRTANVLEPENSADVKQWIDLHLEDIAKLDSKNFHNYANDNSAVLLALDEEHCEKLESMNRSKHVKYACILDDMLFSNCSLALFGKYMDAECINDGIEGINSSLKNVFPTLLDTRMMNDPLLFELRPHNETIYVVSDTPPLVLNISKNVHIIWERTNSQILGVSNPTVLRQSFWSWYGHELKTEEQAKNAVYDVLQQTTPLNISRVFAAMQIKNFSKYFDDTWNGMRELFPKRPKVKTFNFPKIPKIPKIELDLEKDKEIASRFGINVNNLEEKNDKPALEAWGDDFHEKRKGRATLAKFYAPWCGHCKRFAEPYAKIAEELAKDDVNVVKLDVTKHKEVYKVKGIPTVVFFPVEGEEVKFKGKRDVSTVVEWTRKQLKAAAENKKLEL